MRIHVLAPYLSGVRLTAQGRLAGAAIAFVATFLLLTGTAAATAPSTPTITEPATDGQLVHPEDVHMEAGGFSDADNDTHSCTDWEIWTPGLSQRIWHADCKTGLLAGHIHLGDGSYDSSTHLAYDSNYVLRARFHDSAAEVGDWAQRQFGTIPPASPGGDVAWTPVQPGYTVDEIAGDLQLPTNIAFVPNPGTAPGDPLLYITELYGTIKVVTNDGAVSDYATGLLNFNPTGDFPGSGEQGLTGIVVDPSSGDVLASRLVDDSPPSGPHYPQVIRLHSNDGGHTAATLQNVLYMPGETQGQSHQISNLSFGPDGKLYVHMGDGFDSSKSLDLNSFRGKVLRMNLDGTPPADNPFYNAGNGITATDYIYAYGLRNPFGGAWRASNGKHYEVENGPSVDRLARIDPGVSYGYNGSDASMHTNALYNWDPAHAPVSIAFMQPQTFGGSLFPSSQWDHAFVTESGPTYATGPQVRGKRIVEFEPDEGTGELGGHPHDLVEYTGTGKGTAVGLAAGPDGLYFTELYKDLDYTTPIDPGARLFRIRYGSPVAPRLTGTAPGSPANDNWPRVLGSAQAGSTVKLYSDPACTAQVGSASAIGLGTQGIQVSVPDNSTTRFYATASIGGDTSSCSSPLAYVEDSRQHAAFNLKAAKRHCKRKFQGRKRAHCIKRAKQKARAL
jgi:glucose/arabinose dehydrogenase